MHDFSAYIREAAETARRCELIGNDEPEATSPSSKPQENAKSSTSKRAIGLMVAEGQESKRQRTETRSCALCARQGHWLKDCSQFKHELTSQGRLSAVRRLGFCLWCLRGKHMRRDCWGAGKCGVNGCTQSHSHLLHYALTRGAEAVQNEPDDDTRPRNEPQERHKHRSGGKRERDNGEYTAAESEQRGEEYKPDKRPCKEEEGRLEE